MRINFSIFVDALPKFMQDAYRTMCGGNRSCQPKNCLKESDCADGVCLTVADRDGYTIGGVCSKGLMPDGTLCLDDSWCISGKCSRIGPWSAEGTCGEEKPDVASLMADYFPRNIFG